MGNEKVEQQNNDVSDYKKRILVWIKEHRSHFLLAGISVASTIITILGLKNKDAIKEIWQTLRKEILEGSMYSEKWLERADLQQIQEARVRIQQDYRNPELDLEYRNECWNFLNGIDNVIAKRKWQGKEIGYPVHSEHGWYLPSDD